MNLSCANIGRLAAPLLLLLLAACQPSPAERLDRAHSLIDRGDYRAASIELKNVLRDDAQNHDARLLLAYTAYQTADFATAEVEYERLLGSVGDDPKIWVGLGRTLLNQGRATEAFDRVVPSLRDRSEDLKAQVFVADVLATLGNRDEAEKHYQAALAIDENSAEALVGMAVVSAMQDDQPAARSYLDQATERNPDSATAWRAVGNFARLAHDYPAAAAAFEKSIESETVQTPDADRFATRLNHTSVLLDDLKFDRARAQIRDMQSYFGNHPLLYFLRGRLAFGEGDYDVAQRELRDYLARVPDDPRGQAIMGAVNFSQNYLRQAEMFLQQAAREGVGGDVTRRLLAETQLRLDKPDEAIQSLGALGDDSLNDPMILSILGRAELGRGNPESAIRYLEQGVAADPDSPVAQLALAAGLMEADNYAQALTVLQRMPAYSVDGYSRETLLMAALLKLDDQDGAIAVSERLVADKGDDAQAHVLAGMLRFSMDDRASARNDFRDALLRDSKNVSALYGLGRVAEAEGDTAAARDWYRKSVDIDAVFNASLAALARLATALNDYPSVAPRLQQATEASPGSVGLWILRARTALANNRPDESIEIVDKARETHPDEPLLSYVEGLALFQSGQSEAGLRRLSIAAEALPDNPRVQLDLANARLGTGDFRGAQRAIETYRDVKPDDIGGLRVQVEALARDHKVVAARQRLADYRRKHADDPQVSVIAGDLEMIDGDTAAAANFYEAAAKEQWSRPVAVRLARAYQGRDPDKALAVLERWLDSNPDDAQVRRVLAQMLDAKGDDAAAESQYEQVVEQTRDDPIALNNLAWRYSQTGKPGAIKLAERARELAPGNGSINDTLGWILHLDGQHERALEILEEAAQQSPQNLEIQYHVATVQAELGHSADARKTLERMLSADRDFPSRADAEALAEQLK